MITDTPWGTTLKFYNLCAIYIYLFTHILSYVIMKHANHNTMCSNPAFKLHAYEIPTVQYKKNIECGD